MPVYEYECPACNRVFEFEQRISDPVLNKCPQCGGAVQRLIPSSGGFIIKNSAGSGRGGRPRDDGGGCSFEETGTTCCGRQARCEEPGCGSGR